MPKPYEYVARHPSGATLRIVYVCGLRFFTCDRFPEIERHDGAGDDEVCAVLDEFYARAAGTWVEPEPKGAA